MNHLKPDQDNNQARNFIIFLVIAVAVGFFFLFKSLFQAPQRLHFVNELKAAAEVTFPGMDTFSLVPGERKTLEVKPGSYEITYQVDNGPQGTITAELGTAGLNIVNIGGGAVFIWEETIYMTGSAPEIKNKEMPYKLHVDEDFLKIDEPDFIFKEFPEQIQVFSDMVTNCNRLDIVKLEPYQMVGPLISWQVPPPKILAYLENHLNVTPDDETLVQLYVQLGTIYQSKKQVHQFLEKKLAKRPVLTNCHRLYQELAQTPEEKANIIKKYDNLLAKEPDNSALLYLRGRVCTDEKESNTYFEKSIAADPGNPFPHFAKAFHYTSHADLTAAMASITKACQLAPGSKQMKEMYYHLRFALGKYKELEKELKKTQDCFPLDSGVLDKMMAIYIAMKNDPAAQRAMDNFINKYLETIPEDPYQEAAQARLRLAYLREDLDGFEKEATKIKDETTRSKHLFTLYLNRGEMEKAETLAYLTANPDGYTCLLYWLGWLEQGRQEKAAPWLEKAKEKFAASQAEDRLVAEWLDKTKKSQGDISMVKRLDGLTLHFFSKRLLYTVFAKLYPAEKQQLFNRARALNFTLDFPHHFLAKIIP